MEKAGSESAQGNTGIDGTSVDGSRIQPCTGESGVAAAIAATPAVEDEVPPHILTAQDIAENERLEAINVERRREMNMIHSRRKRERQKIEIAVLREQTAELSAKNLNLYHRNKKLEKLIEDGKEVVAEYDKLVKDSPSLKRAVTGEAIASAPLHLGDLSGLARLGQAQHMDIMSPSNQPRVPADLPPRDSLYPMNIPAAASATPMMQQLGPGFFNQLSTAAAVQPNPMQTDRSSLMNSIGQGQFSIQGDHLRTALIQQELQNLLAQGRFVEFQQLQAQMNLQGQSSMFQPLPHAGSPQVQGMPLQQQGQPFFRPQNAATGFGQNNFAHMLGATQGANHLHIPQLPILHFPNRQGQGFQMASFGNPGSLNPAMLDLQSRLTASQGVLPPATASLQEPASVDAQSSNPLNQSYGGTNGGVEASALPDIQASAEAQVEYYYPPEPHNTSSSME